MNSHISVTLLSKTSQKLYPSNTLSSFTVHLAHVELGSTHNGRWVYVKCHVALLMWVRVIV
jgi:hypothetical protein